MCTFKHQCYTLLYNYVCTWMCVCGGFQGFISSVLIGKREKCIFFKITVVVEGGVVVWGNPQEIYISSRCSSVQLYMYVYIYVHSSYTSECHLLYMYICMHVHYSYAQPCTWHDNIIAPLVYYTWSILF